MRPLASHQCDAGSIAAGVLWLEFVVGCSVGFSQVTSVYLPTQKPTSLNSSSTRIEDLYEHQLTSFINIVIYLLIDFICLFISKAFVVHKQVKICDKHERPS